MEKQVKELIDLVGGKDNVRAVSHCVTRLRFVLIDDEKVNAEAISNLKMVKGTFNQGGQFQVIIGADVEDAYKALVTEGGFSTMSKSDVKEVGAKKGTLLQRGVAFMAEIFIPILPAIIVGGLILGFRNILEMPMQQLLDGASIISLNQFWAGVDTFLWLLGSAIFAYLPVHVVWSTHKKMGGTEVLGIVLGITLVDPSMLTNAYDVVAATQAGTLNSIDFGSFQLNLIGYQAQVLPALMVGLFSGWLERTCKKFVPNFLHLIIVPFIVLVLSLIMAHFVIGPIGWAIGQVVSQTIVWLFSTLGIFAGFIFGFIYAPLVITGMHHLVLPIDLQLIADLGGTFIWPIIACSNIAQGAAVAGTMFVHKTAEDKELAVPSVISAWLGVTEPAMFGVNLRFFSPFIAGMIGAGLAGAWCIFTGVMANSIGVGGLPAILSIQPQYWGVYLIAMLIAIIVPLVLTIAFLKGNMFKKKAK